MKTDKIVKALHQVALCYPPALIRHEQDDVSRIAAHITLALDGRDPSDLSVCDIGGGVGLFSPGCAVVGCRNVFLVDDFQDGINKEVGDSAFMAHQKHGVKVIKKDVISEGVDGIQEGSLDTVSSFNSMEHWHHSPRDLFHICIRLLKPGGLFLLGVPNRANFKKRVIIPFGFGKWSPMSEWYDEKIFRGHVREPDVDDLRYMARDLRLKNVRIYGRCWGARRSPNMFARALSATLDVCLRPFPSLCSDIYLLGQKG